MKKTLLYLFGILCMMNAFTACESDPEYIGTELDGVYKGTLDIALGADLVGKDLPQKVYITKVGENQIKMELRNFSFSGMQLGDITVDRNDVSKNGAECTFTGSQLLTLAAVGDCQVDITGVIVNDKITMDIKVATTIVGEVTVNFDGSKMAKDLSSEAVITEFKFASDKVTTQPTINEGNILFIVSDLITNEELKALAPTITVSEGATVTPESGVAQDFTKPVTYTVVSADGITTTVYMASILGKNSKFTFEEWTVVKDPTVGSTEQYENPTGTWGTSNEGIMYMKTMLSELTKRFEYPVAPTSVNVKEGAKAAVIKTIYTYIDYQGNDFNAMFGLPYVTAGSVFPGVFKTDANDYLKSTKFGVLFNGKPTKFSGWYKYTPGPVYYSSTNQIMDIKDKCSIYALLYEEVLDSKNNNIPLDGKTIKDSPRIILKATLKDGSAKADWTRFDLSFEPVAGRTYSKDKKYYMTFVCSSSFDGDTYNGAPGSTLVIDDMEIFAE